MAALVRVREQRVAERASVLVQAAERVQAAQAAPVWAAERPAVRPVVCWVAVQQANRAAAARVVQRRAQRASGVELPIEMAPNAVRPVTVPAGRSVASVKTDPAALAPVKTAAVRRGATTNAVALMRETVGQSAVNAARLAARLTAWVAASGPSFASRSPAWV
ncbi:hypothetical protein [Methylobacterium radiodurans]|uniref:hypothetical protein n=1 Tax=Methylobacterium radiodurans TaxID=2202828 RepID=UPI00269447F0